MTMSIDGETYQVRLKWRLHGQQCLNVLFFTSRGSQNIEQNLLQVLITCVTDNLMPILSSEVALESVDFKNVTGSVAQEGEVPGPQPAVGEIVGNSLPSTNAAVIKINSIHPGRTGKGRMFLPGIPESEQANSLVDATFLAAAAAFLVCMIAGFYDADPLATPKFHWMLRSKKDATFYQITGGTPKALIGTLRSRKVGRGI